jgi:hypothetical protein
VASTRTKILAGVLSAVAATGAGFGIHELSTAGSYRGDSAAAVAKALGCTGYERSGPAGTAGTVSFHDQGTCKLDRYTVKVTTFDDAGEQKAFGILTSTLVPAYTHKGGAYAEGDGWNVADDTGMSLEAAVLASNQLDGVVQQFSASQS